jgi:protein Mpv17
MAADQLFFAPIFLAIFFCYNSVFEQGRLSSSDMLTKLRRNYIPALKANWKVWPLVQCINFYLVPLQYRLVFVNVVALGWNAYLSMLNSKGPLNPSTTPHKTIV